MPMSTWVLRMAEPVVTTCGVCAAMASAARADGATWTLERAAEHAAQLILCGVALSDLESVRLGLCTYHRAHLTLCLAAHAAKRMRGAHD